MRLLKAAGMQLVVLIAPTVIVRMLELAHVLILAGQEHVTE